MADLPLDTPSIRVRARLTLDCPDGVIRYQSVTWEGVGGVPVVLLLTPLAAFAAEALRPWAGGSG